MRKKIINPLLFYAIALNLAISSCSGKVKENNDGELKIDPEYSQIFFSVSSQKYMVFRNQFGRKKFIAITNVDSTIYNPAPGGIMRGKPYKIYTLEMRQVGSDTLRLERENSMFVNYYPEEQKNSFSISFLNLDYYSNTLPQINTDTQRINGYAISNYYIFTTALRSTQSDDVVELYISIDNGIVAFKTLCGDFWVREK